MNKAQLIDALTERMGDKKAANNAVESVVDVITRAVSKGEKVSITGFGVFERQERAARTARNPATGATVKVKKTSVPRFRPGQSFKDVVSGAKKLPKVGSKTAPVKAAPTKAAAKTSPVKAAGTKAAGTKAAGTKAAGTRAAGTKAAGTRAAGTRAAGTRAAGTRAAAMSTEKPATAARRRAGS